MLEHLFKRSSRHGGQQSKFLKYLLEANKVVVNNDVRDMVFTVRERLRQSIRHLTGTEQGIADIVLCGSVGDRTRLWEYEEHRNDSVTHHVLVIEFDFLAVQIIPVSMFRYQQGTFMGVFNEECSDHTAVLCNTLSHPLELSYTNKDGRADPRVSPHAFRRWFRSEVLQNITREDGLDGLTFTPSMLNVEDHKDDSIRYAFTWNQPLTQRPRPTTCPEGSNIRYDGCAIKVDFMPVFQCMNYNTDIHIPDFLVPKYQSDHGTCFLKSYCEQEQHVLHTSRIHQQANMLLKSLYRHAHCEIPTYILKTVVLNHAVNCTNPNLVACLREMLQRLSNSLASCKLQSFMGHLNLLSHWRPHVLERLKCVPDTLVRFLDDLKKGSRRCSFRENIRTLDARCSRIRQWRSNRVVDKRAILTG